MSIIDFDELPDTTRLWIYASERAFSDSEQNLIESEMSQFLEEWTAHKRELKTGWQLAHGQFILVAVDESMMTASGCSIDSMANYLAQLQSRLNCKIVGTHASIFFRDENGEVQCADRPQFKQLLSENRVNAETKVFDNTIRTLGDFRQGKWELAMKHSWHGPAFLKAA